MKKIMKIILCVFLLGINGCQSTKEEEVTLLIAAASLENCYEDELIPMFEKEHSNIKIEGTYDSSGKLQTQIEEGLEADLFMSAATKQMNDLNEKGCMNSNSIVHLLENELVLITYKDSKTIVTDFTNIQNADTVAIGDPNSVPAGQYAKESLTNIGNYEKVLAKSSLATNVTEVLSWVEAESAEVGIVYSSDASQSQKVKVLASAPASSLQTPVIYPVGIVKNTKHLQEAELFLEFLQTKEAKNVFKKYGFKVE